MEFKALLFDTRSIQRYIYSGNRLKTNIGASYLVDRVFEDVLIAEVLQSKEFFGDEVDNDRRFSKTRVDWSAMQKKCAVAYIGGGNALILFAADTEDGIEKKIVRKFSETLLIRCPGLHIGAAFGPLDFSSPEAFQAGIDALYENLKKNQTTVFPLVNVPYTGLTLACEVNGEAANYYAATKKGVRFFSQEVAAKENAEKKASDDLRGRFQKRFAETGAADIFEKYVFPRSLDELGQKRNETRGNYIAVVHIDGNNMGKKFRLLCKDLEDRRILAADIREKTEGSFVLLLRWIMEQCESDIFKNELELIPKKKDSSIPAGKKILPIRPLILGGDDVTFICPAKVALLFTKRFMEILLADPPKEMPEIQSPAARRMDSCAGIAILPTAYPFFRGYELAEQLCEAAKRNMRAMLSEMSDAQEENIAIEDLRGTAWLDFALLHGEQAPTLEQIRAQEYTGMRGPMHFGPYQVAAEREKQEAAARRHNIARLIECVHAFQNGAKTGALPKSKIKALRSILQGGKSETVRFIAQMERLDQHIPQIDGWEIYTENNAAFWNENGKVPETPYVDAIEMMDFIPEEA